MAEDFSLDSHQRIYRCILALMEQGHGVDLTTVRAELEGGASWMRLVFVLLRHSAQIVWRRNSWHSEQSRWLFDDVTNSIQLFRFFI